MAGKIDRLDIVGRNDMKWSYSKSTNEYKEREREKQWEADIVDM